MHAYEWNKQLLEHGVDVFSSAAEKAEGLSSKERQELIQTIGHQTVVIDLLKKTWERGFEERREMIDERDSPLSVAQQCQ